MDLSNLPLQSQPTTWSRKKIFGVILRVVLVAIIIGYALTAGKARGQGRQYDVREQSISRLKFTSDWRNVFRDPNSFSNPAILKNAETRLRSYIIPEFTKHSPKALAKMTKLRVSLVRDISNTKVDAAKKHFSKILFAELQPIVNGNFHPAVRYNALLMIGQLNESGGGNRPGAPATVPVAGAFDFLLETVNKNPTSLRSPLKIGALVGLQRHAKYRMSTKNKNKLVEACIAIMNVPLNKNAKNLDGPLWLQTLAAETLAGMKTLGKDQRIHQAFTKMLGDKDRPLAYRCRVANAMVKLKDQYSKAQGIDSAATQKAFIEFCTAFLKEESDFSTEYIEEITNPTAQLYEEETTYPRARVLYRVNIILDLHKTIKKALPEKAETDAIVAFIEKIKAEAIEASTDIGLPRLIRDGAGDFIEVETPKKDKDKDPLLGAVE